MTGILVELLAGAGPAWSIAGVALIVFMAVVLSFVGLAVGRALFAGDPATRTDARHVLRDLLGSFFRRPR
ncbi:hypothetical protein OHA25_60270 (plasmid) [Nonomuraea sp. NBC_00507]|uniref:hypothetical protein n=1 Tax=Nonomuraea sp. NBC_00507 TaxID=2976002 RepID=UPI002E17C6AE